MDYILMHREVPVLEMKLDEATCTIAEAGALSAPEHMPVGIAVRKGRVDRAALNVWWADRAIPMTRDGIRRALEMLRLPSTQLLLDKCFGLNLSDHYWICPKDSKFTWAEKNFFENEFSPDMGDLLFGKAATCERTCLLSPDCATNGWLRKSWRSIQGQRCLVKGGSGATQQEPYNEVLASAIMRRLSIPHVSYSLTYQDEYPYSVCEDFITPQTELVPAWYIMQTQKKPNDISVYQHYLNCCETLGIPGVADALDRMMVVDYIIANEDRHQNNFGAVRDAGTLSWLGAAPLYDSGTSLWFDKPVGMIKAGGKLTCKPFKTTHEEQIKLVRSFDWLDLAALHGIEDEFREIVSGSPFIDDARCDALCRALRGRIERLSAIINQRPRSVAAVSLHGDVQADEAYSGASDLDEQER